jgi:CheY-like chemotaxis protein
MNFALRTNETLSVLIVDDDPEIRLLIKECLDEIRCFSFIVEAKDGRDALQKASLQQFDVIVTDLSMPKMEGISFIDMCKTHNKLKYCAFMIISGEITPDRLHQAKQLGVSSILAKPFSIGSFQEKIKNLLLQTKKNKLIVA